MPYPEPVLVAICVVFGLLIGSFLNVVAWRVPRAESIVTPGSRCPACGADIRPIDNVPVVSWLFLRGRCRDCGAGISVRYPLVELATGIVFGLVAAAVGWSWLLPIALVVAAVAVVAVVIGIDRLRAGVSR